MGKLISIGTSASKGLGLHLYNRSEITNTFNDFNVSESEYDFNLKHSYSVLLADKLNKELVQICTGYNHSFFNEIDNVISQINLYKDVDIVILQLSNLHRDFFIYNEKSYKLDFETYDGFIKSKNELIKDKDETFIEQLELDLELFLRKEPEWRAKQVKKMIYKIEEFRLFLLNKNIQFKILMYFDDWLVEKEYFLSNNLLVKLNKNDREYINVFDFVHLEKLRVSDTLSGCLDHHPNFEAHQIITDCIYKSLNI